MKTMDAKLAFEEIKNLLDIPKHKLDNLLEVLVLLERDSYGRGIKSLIEKLKGEYEESL